MENEPKSKRRAACGEGDGSGGGTGRSGEGYHTVEKKLTATPTKEWTVVEIPFEVGEKGLTSFDEMYTFEIRFVDPNVRVMIDQVKLVPLVK